MVDFTIAKIATLIIGLIGGWGLSVVVRKLWYKTTRNARQAKYVSWAAWALFIAITVYLVVGDVI